MPTCRPSHRSTVPQMGLTLVRVLTASYLMAGATSAMMAPVSQGPHGLHLAVLAVAFAVMTGTVLRPAALALAGLVFVPGLVLGNGSDTLAALAGDTALLGTLLLIALATPNRRQTALTRDPTQSDINVTARPPLTAGAGDDPTDNIFFDLWDTPAANRLAA